MPLVAHASLPAFEDLRHRGEEVLSLDDALIIAGANVANPSLEQEPFWEPLNEVVSWARENVVSILCSCLATHALVKRLYGIDRHPMPQKLWGVYSHRISQETHPLLRDINTRFDAPHSRFNEITRDALEEAGVRVLVEAEDAGVHLAVSPDQHNTVYFQGHPEYDWNSLPKEYRREVRRHINGEREDYPPHPANYFSSAAAAVADRYQQDVDAAQQQDGPAPPFPESELEPYVDNTWGDTGKAIFNNWLGLVYQEADIDRPSVFDEVRTRTGAEVPSREQR